MLKTWVCTCSGCPTQYEGYLESGEYVYFRYRWGWASLEISRSIQDWWSNEYVFGKVEKIGDEWAGVLGEWEVRDLIAPWIETYIKENYGGS